MKQPIRSALLLLALCFAQSVLADWSSTRSNFPSGRPPEIITAPAAATATGAGTDTFEEVYQTGHALHTYKAYRDAGERNEESTTGTDYLSVSDESVCTAVDTATDSTTVYNGPAILSYIYVNTVLSAHTVVISDNATSKFVLPASLAAGTERRLPGAQFRTSLVVDPDNSSTGNITVCYRPLDPSVTH